MHECIWGSVLLRAPHGRVKVSLAEFNASWSTAISLLARLRRITLDEWHGLGATFQVLALHKELYLLQLAHSPSYLNSPSARKW